MQSRSDTHAVLPAGAGELIELAGNRIRIIVASPSQLVCDYSAAANFAGPPLHVHPGFDETYLVLEGELRIVVGNDERTLGPGAAAYVRGTTPHTFSNPGDEQARFLSICSPGGFEHFFRALATNDQELLTDICDRVGYRTVEAAA